MVHAELAHMCHGASDRQDLFLFQNIYTQTTENFLLAASVHDASAEVEAF